MVICAASQVPRHNLWQKLERIKKLNNSETVSCVATMPFSIDLFQDCPYSDFSVPTRECVDTVMSRVGKDDERAHEELLGLFSAKGKKHKYDLFSFLLLLCKDWALPAELHFQLSECEKPIASGVVSQLLDKLRVLSLSVADLMIREHHKYLLDNTNPVDQAIFVFLNLQYVPDSIIDSHRQLQLGWKLDDSLSALAHAVASALVQTMSVEQMDTVCRRGNEVGMMPSLTMIMASVRGRGCTFLSHPELAYQLSFGINMDSLLGNDVFCSPLFLLLRPTWRLSDLTPDVDSELSSAFEACLLPQLMRFEDSYCIGGDDLQLLFTLRYLMTISLYGLQGFQRLARQAMPLVAQHMIREIGPLPCFLRTDNDTKHAKISAAFRRDVAECLKSADCTGALPSRGGQGVMLVSFLCSSRGIYCFVRSYNPRSTIARSDYIVYSIAYEDSIRQALFHVPDYDTLCIASPKHCAFDCSSIPAILQQCLYVDTLSEGLCDGLGPAMEAIGRFDCTTSKYGVTTCLVVRPA